MLATAPPSGVCHRPHLRAVWTASSKTRAGSCWAVVNGGLYPVYDEERCDLADVFLGGVPRLRIDLHLVSSKGRRGFTANTYPCKSRQ